MIWIDKKNKEIRVSEDTPLDELARYLYRLGETKYKIVIYGTDSNTDTSG